MDNAEVSIRRQDRARASSLTSFTKAADQKNAENLLVIRDDKIAAKYEAHFGNVPRFIEHLDFSYSTAP